MISRGLEYCPNRAVRARERVVLRIGYNSLLILLIYAGGIVLLYMLR